MEFDSVGLSGTDRHKPPSATHQAAEMDNSSPSPVEAPAHELIVDGGSCCMGGTGFPADIVEPQAAVQVRRALDATAEGQLLTDRKPKGCRKQ